MIEPINFHQYRRNKIKKYLKKGYNHVRQKYFKEIFNKYR